MISNLLTGLLVGLTFDLTGLLYIIIKAGLKDDCKMEPYFAYMVIGVGL